MKVLFIFSVLLSFSAAQAGQEYLVKFTKEGVKVKNQLMASMSAEGSSIENVGLEEWALIKTANSAQAEHVQALRANTQLIAHVQPNYPIRLLENYQQKPSVLAVLRNLLSTGGIGDLTKPPPPDNPAIPPKSSVLNAGPDPLYNKQWGMVDMGVQQAAQVAQGEGVVVAVIDTGVDYTHEDLLPNMWRNPNEIPDNGIDDDHNGFVDDVVGWDFVSNDNKPYDFKTSLMDLLMSGGNPGHGTHCAGNVAARGNNNLGITGVAPKAQIMAIRFLSEKGSGTTADAIKSIKYAVDNGANVLSNSWGSSGEDPNEAQDNQALRDVIKYAQSKNVIFIAAAGNGDSQGKGYNNDTSKQPAYPASYDIDNIVSVAAIDSQNQLGSFSNWGAKTVDIGAPGVKVFSTISGGGYDDTVADLSDFGMGVATWDGTSMATPHVAGAAALYLSAHPGASWQQVKSALLTNSVQIPALQGKTVSGGKLNATGLVR